MIPLSIYKSIYRKVGNTCVWLSALLLTVGPLFSSLSSDIIQPHNDRKPVVTVYYNKKDLTEYKNRFKNYRPEKFKTAWSKQIREIHSTWQTFLTEYGKIPLELHEESISLYFFSKDGVYLWHKHFSAGNSTQNLPDWEILQINENWNKEYNHYKKTNQTKRSLLFWPLRAYESNRYRLARVWLAKVNTSRLTKDEKDGYETLKKLLAKIQSPE